MTNTASNAASASVESRRVATDTPLADTGAAADAADAVLVARVRQGDRRAFEGLVRRYEKRLLRLIYRLVHNVETAEDLAQDAFLKAYDRLAQFDASRRFGPWLFQIAVHGAIDWLRRHKRQHLLSLNDMARGESPYPIADEDPRGKADLSQEVHHVLAQLPIQYRTVLILRDLEGFPSSEVAAIVGRQEPTVRWRLLRARELFRELWEKRNGAEARAS